MSSEAERLRRAPVAARTHEDDSESASRFTALYEEHFDYVWRTMRLLGVPHAAVDDAVQDVFLVAHRRLADFEARASVRTWLFAIALRVVSDYRRSRGRRFRLLEQARTRITERDPVPTPYDSAVDSEAHERLLVALDSLHEDQRAVFVLTELEEMTAPEISVALQLNLNTVYSRLRAARREVARLLQGAIGGDLP